ncbi:MAG: DUF177 domain-containing protein [bacterium]
MFNIFIQGLKDGEHDVDMLVPVEDVPEMFGEYFGMINLKGRLKKIGNRFTLFARAASQAKMICDMTLEEFTETIMVDVNLSFVVENKLAENSRRQIAERQNKKQETEGVRVSADGKYADISGEIREIFAVSLPMKRIAPKYRDKELKEIFPEFDAGNDEPEPDFIDERWAPLKKINNN